MLLSQEHQQAHFQSKSQFQQWFITLSRQCKCIQHLPFATHLEREALVSKVTSHVFKCFCQTFNHQFVQFQVAFGQFWFCIVGQTSKQKSNFNTDQCFPVCMCEFMSTSLCMCQKKKNLLLFSVGKKRCAGHDSPILQHLGRFDIFFPHCLLWVITQIL